MLDTLNHKEKTMFRSVGIASILLIFVSGCSTLNQAPPENNYELVWQSHDERPLWTIESIPKNDRGLQVIGLSDYYTSERIAKDAAYVDASANAARYFISRSSEQSNLIINGQNASSKQIDSELQFSQTKSLETNYQISRILPSAWYIEQYKNDVGILFFKAFLKIHIPETEVKAAEKRAKKYIDQADSAS